jgi:hypothetical protein
MTAHLRMTSRSIQSAPGVVAQSLFARGVRLTEGRNMKEKACKTCKYYRTNACIALKEEGVHPAPDDWCMKYKPSTRPPAAAFGNAGLEL